MWPVIFMLPNAQITNSNNMDKKEGFQSQLYLQISFEIYVSGKSCKV